MNLEPGQSSNQPSVSLLSINYFLYLYLVSYLFQFVIFALLLLWNFLNLFVDWKKSELVSIFWDEWDSIISKREEENKLYEGKINLYENMSISCIYLLLLSSNYSHISFNAK